MYVRTKKGEIFDCYESEQMHKPIYYPKKSKTNGYIDYEDVYKKSDNLIDILQVGDYVNGSKIIELATNIDGKILYLETDITEFDNVYACGNINIYEKDIKSIVTKEQFSQMEYRIGE